MDFAIDLPNFEGRGLIYRSRALFAGPTILVDEKPAVYSDVESHYFNQEYTRTYKERVYKVPDNQGRNVHIKVKRSVIDPVNALEINGEIVRFKPKLELYEYVWLLIPLLAIYMLGGIFIGLGGAYLNLWVYRGNLRDPMRYLIPACINLVIVGTIGLAWYKTGGAIGLF